LAIDEETPTSAEVSEETLKWPLPFNVSLDKLDMMVKGFFQAQADTRSISGGDLSRLTGLNINTIKANIRFLQAIKILKAEEGKDAYLFEEKGTEYAKALSTNDVSKASSILKQLLVDSSLKELVGFVELNKSSGELNYEPLFAHIKAMARVKDNPNFPRGVSPPYSYGISTLIELLVRAGIAPQDIMATKKEVPRAPQIRKSRAKSETQPMAAPPAPPTTTIQQRIQERSANLPFTINITVEAKDPESIKELINLLRELRQQFSAALTKT